MEACLLGEITIYFPLDNTEYLRPDKAMISNANFQGSQIFPTWKAATQCTV